MEHNTDEEQKMPKICTLGKDDDANDEELKQAQSLRAKMLKYRECFPTEMRDIDFNGVAKSEDLDFLEEKCNSVRIWLAQTQVVGQELLVLLIQPLCLP